VRPATPSRAIRPSVTRRARGAVIRRPCAVGVARDIRTTYRLSRSLTPQPRAPQQSRASSTSRLRGEQPRRRSGRVGDGGCHGFQSSAFRASVRRHSWDDAVPLRHDAATGPRPRTARAYRSLSARHRARCRLQVAKPLHGSIPPRVRRHAARDSPSRAPLGRPLGFGLSIAGNWAALSDQRSSPGYSHQGAARKLRVR
jgi:hypothetical protein